MTKRAELEKIMRDIDAMISSMGVKTVHLNNDDFDIVAEHLKWDKQFYPEGIPYNGKIIKKVNVRKK